MYDIYKQILQSLKSGKHISMISKYSAAGIIKSLSEGEWNGAGGLSFSVDENQITIVERYSPKPRLIILGGGHIALPLSSFGASLGFDVVVFDDRPAFANAERFPNADVVCDGFANAMNRLDIRKTDYVVIVTRGHRYDSLCLRELLDGEFPLYVGMIGSRRRVAIVKKQMEEETGAVSRLAQLHAPIGLSIGAVTPEEIAISILAEIISVKRSGDTCDFSTDMELLEWLAGHTEKSALVTVVSTNGSTPRETGAKMAVLQHGQVVGSIGGGCAEAEAIRNAISIIKSGGYMLTDIDMTDSAEEDGMVCGGVMKVLTEAL